MLYFSIELRVADYPMKSGGLDSGMGFESLKGALLTVKETETVILKGKEYQREDSLGEFIGNLTEAEQDFLLDCQF